jgi:class 3 adenylate cyclase
VRVRAFAFMGGVTVRSRPIKDDTEPSGQGHALSSGSRSRRNPPDLPNLPNRPDRPDRGRDRDRDRARDRDRHRAHDHRHLGWDDDAPTDPLPRRDLEVGPAELASIADTTPEGTVTILFSDIEGFTEINERLGDGPARDILLEHNRIVRSHIERCGGHEVKFQGDGFMVAFAGAGKALGCAVDLQQALDEWSSSGAAEPLRVRIGLHTGEVVREDQDFLGRTVNIASRIADQAKGGEVLVSSLLKELATGTGFRFGEPREAVLKGLTGTFTLYPVVWR